MILVCGTKLKLKDLPNADFLDYYIENDDASLAITLSMMLMNDSIYQYAFVSANYTSLVQNAGIPITYFKNDNDLVSLLNTYGMENVKQLGSVIQGADSDFQMIADLQSELDTKELENKQLLSDLDMFKDKVAENEALIEELQNSLKEAESNEKKLQESLDEIGDKVDTADTLRDEIESLQNQIKVKDARLSSYENGENPEIDELKGRLEEYESGNNPALEEANNRVKELEDAKQKEVVKVEELKGKIAELQGKYNELQDSSESKERELQAKIEELQKKVEEATITEVDTTELDELQGKFDALTVEYATYKEQQETTYNELQGKYNALEIEYEDYKNTETASMGLLQSQYDTLQQQKEEMEQGKTPAHLQLEQEYNQLQADYEALKTTESPELLQLKTEYNTLQTEKQTVDMQLQQVQEELGKAQKAQIELQSLNTTLQESVNAKSLEISKQKSEFDLKISELNINIARLPSLESTIQSLKDNIAEKQQAITTLITEKGTLEAEKIAINADLSKVKSDLKIAQDNLDFEREMRNQAVEKQKNECQIEIDRLNSELDATNERLKELKKSYSDEVLGGNSVLDVALSTPHGNKDYDSYAVKPKSQLAIDLSERERGYFRFTNKVVLLSSCGDGSTSIMREAIKNWVDIGYNMCIIDFTGDMYLTFNYKLQGEVRTGSTTGDMLKQNANIGQSMFKKVKNALFVPCVPFNDLALLEQNWGKLLNEIAAVIPADMPIVVVLSGFENFTTRYVVQKLSSRYKLMLFIDGQPGIMYSTSAFLKMLESKNIGIIAGNVVPSMAQKLQASLLNGYKGSKSLPKGTNPTAEVLEDYLK